MKLPGVDPKLMPEMKSTGELIAVANDVHNSLEKRFYGMNSSSMRFQKRKKFIWKHALQKMNS